MNEPAPAEVVLPARFARCRERLTARARRDRYLGRADERPRLDKLLGELEAILAHDEADFAEPFQTVARQLTQHAGEVGQALEAVRPGIEATFAALAEPPTAAQTRDAARALQSIAESLARQVRHKLLRLLGPAAPTHELVPNLLRQIEDGRRGAIETLPESLWLVYARRSVVVTEPGRSLFDSRIEPELPQLCRSRLLAGWRLRRRRRALRRDYRLIEIDLRETATETLLARSDIKPAALEQRHASTHQTLDDQLGDAWRALRYALDTAVVELDDAARLPDSERASAVPPKAAELAALTANAIDKTLAVVHDAETVYPTIFDGIVAEVIHDRENGLTATRQAIATAGDLRERLRFTWKTLRKTSRRRLGQLRERAAAGLVVGQRMAHTLTRRGERALLDVKDTLGFGEVSEEQQLAIADLPSPREMTERIHTLPPIYRRLFSTEPLLNREFLVGRDDELAALGEAYERWGAKRATNIAIVGSEGSGKSSLINCFENEIAEGADIVRIDLNERLRTAADVVRVLAAGLGLTDVPGSVAAFTHTVLAGPRRVVIAHRTHNMYLRAVGGAEAPRAFARILLATRAHLLWITSYRLYPWRRLDQLFDSARYFTHVLETDLHAEAELREAVLRRQRTTDDTLQFSDHQLNVRSIRRLRLAHELDSPVVQKALAERYFSTLFKVSGGNLESAFFFWLLSLRTEQAGRIAVQPAFRLDDRLIRSLERLDHFTLAELIGHGYLTVDEHAEIFRIDPQRSRLTLENLAQLRIVDSAGADDNGDPLRYGLSAVFQQAVAAALTDMNILY